ncbi:hypothetical protein [Cohnella hashimotonis]|uniref:DUF3221 domain-containing protein n=1 Tax=Cohnella hashimotonis TaxID=2826895 RepID=A0ABT6TW86_9BACL|nr:hypothetical protein [Cohnella hashimotonis]MDI4650229.1 hypothetical protein [Cohnella hashimotonis]
MIIRVARGAAVLLLGSVLLGACADKEPSAVNAVNAPTGGSVAEAGVQSDSAERPSYLPAGFPLPDDADIRTSHQETTDGKRSVLLIFATKKSMDEVSALYKDYFDAELGENAVQTVDDKNLIIQGNSKTEKETWSMIGGPLAAEDGVVELTLTWTEV